MQTSTPTSLFLGVPDAGLHLASKSGRGRPTAFLKVSVRKEVRKREMKRPRTVTWILDFGGRVSRKYNPIVRRGTKRE